MHHIYTTPAIILHREPLDTSASYNILTRDFGLIRARAQGVRGVSSRLKGTLQEFSYSTIAFVHGKAGWKITTAIPERNFFIDTKNNQNRKIMAHIKEVLIRLIVGEEKSFDIFSVIEKGFTVLVDEHSDSSLVEILILVRLLYILGYLAIDENTRTILTEYRDFSPPLVSLVFAQKSSLIKAINRGLKESQL